MSSSKFEEKRRVAHSTNPAAEAVRKQLEMKKQAMAAVAARINNGSLKSPPSASLIGKVKGPAAKKARRGRSSSEDGDDDFLDDGEEPFISDGDTDDDDEDALGMSEDEGERRRKKQRAETTAAVAAKVVQNETRAAAVVAATRNKDTELKLTSTPNGHTNGVAKKQATLSDSDDEEGGWQSKPRLGFGSNHHMQTSKANKSAEKKPRKKIVISSDEEFIDDDEDERRPKKRGKCIESSPEYVPGSEDAQAKQKKEKEKKKKKPAKRADSDSEGNYNSESGDDARAESDSEASDDGHVSGAVLTMRSTTVDFFNTASRESLLAAPRINDRIADHLLAKRPFENYHALVESFVGMRPRVSGPAIVDAYMEHLENRGVLQQILVNCRAQSSKVAEDQEIKRVDLPLLTSGFTLHEYQHAGVDWLAEMHKKELNAILADEMGLGKTIQIIAFLSWLKSNGVKGPHLIVVPSSTVENWMAELKRWCSALKFITYYGTMDERKDIRHAAKKKKETVDVLLTTYNMTGSRPDDRKFFKHFSINYVIFDEGHMLKNCSTDRYKSLLKIKTQRKILLTGTPLQNNLIELISLMYFTIPKVFNKYCDDVTQLLSHFKQTRPALEGTDAMLYNSDRIEQAKAILQPYILRRVKAQVLLELPPKSEETIEIEMQEDQADLYEDVTDALRKTDESDPRDAYGGLMRLRQAANHPLLRRRNYDDGVVRRIAKQLCSREKPYLKKNPEYVAEELAAMSDFQLHQLCEKFIATHKFLLDEDLALRSGKLLYLDKKLEEIKQKGDKVLIFSQFTTMLDILEVYLRVRDYTFARLDGSTPVLERLEMINAYNSDPDQFVFLLSTKAGGLGINLVSANHIIIHDIDFNPYNDKQAEDRCHRMGQKKPVYVTRLISKDTIEVEINRLARKKLQLEKDVTKGSRGLAEEVDESSSQSNEAGGPAKGVKGDVNEDESMVSDDEAKALLSECIARSPVKTRTPRQDGNSELAAEAANGTPNGKSSRGKESSTTPAKRGRGGAKKK